MVVCLCVCVCVCILCASSCSIFFLTQSDGWENVVTHGDESLHPIVIFLRLLYFSVSTATLCGEYNPSFHASESSQIIQLLCPFVFFKCMLISACPLIMKYLSLFFRDVISRTVSLVLLSYCRNSNASQLLLFCLHPLTDYSSTQAVQVCSTFKANVYVKQQKKLTI